MSELVTSIDETLWICESEPLDPCVAGARLVRRMENVDATYADGLLTTIKSTTSYSSPQADKQTYTGTWYNSQTIGQQSPANERYIDIVQTLTLVATITDAASLPTKIRMEGRDAITPFALETTTEDFISDQWLYLNPANEAVIEALTLTTLTPAGYTEVKRRTDIEHEGDRTCTLSVLWKKVTAVAWGGAADIEGYDNYGYLSDSSKGEKTIYTREWYCIAKASQSTALVNLYKGNTTATAILTGYIIMDVKVRDQQDGGLTLTQRQIEQVSNKPTASLKTDDTLGLQPIPIGVNEVIFDDFTATGLASAIGSLTPGTGVLDGYTTDIKENGMYRRVYRYLNPTYPNTLTSSVPVNAWQHAEEGAQSIVSAGDRKHYLAPGLDVDNIETVVQKLKTTVMKGTGVVVGVSTSLGQSGDMTVNQTLAVANTDITSGTRDFATTTGAAETAGAFLLERGKNDSGVETVLKRWWPSVTTASAKTLCTGPSGYAVSNVQLENVTYLHRKATIVYDMQTGLCDVYQECNTGADNVTWHKTGYNDMLEEHMEYINKTNYCVATQQLITAVANTTDALAYMNGTSHSLPSGWTLSTPVHAVDHNQFTPIMAGHMELVDNGTLYDCRRVIYKASTTFISSIA